MTQPLYFDDLGTWSSTSSQMGADGSTASQSATTGVSSLDAASASSPAGQVAAANIRLFHGGLAATPGVLDWGATSVDGNTQTGVTAVGNIDQQNAENVRRATAGQVGQPPGQGGQPAGQGGQPGGGLPPIPGIGGDPLDPESIDQEAREKAEQLLEGDQLTQQMGQMMGMVGQMGGQIAQQVSQQLNQVTQKLGEITNQVGEQAGQLMSQVVQSATESATADLGAMDFGSDPGGIGGGGFGGGGGDFGQTVPAGITDGTGPATPAITASSAIAAGASPGTGVSAPASSNSMPGRGMMPMMPMMPMAGRGGAAGKGRERDPNIFPEGPIFEPPTGVEQNLGANPAIDAEEPPEWATAKD